MIFLAPVKCFLVEISWDHYYPNENLEIQYHCSYFCFKKAQGEKNQARFGSVFETIKLSSARLAKKEARIHHYYVVIE